jgi:hypothetical protein
LGGEAIVANQPGPIALLPNTIAKQSGELDSAAPLPMVYDETTAGNVQPPEIDAYPIPGLQQR